MSEWSRSRPTCVARPERLAEADHAVSRLGQEHRRRRGVARRASTRGSPKPRRKVFRRRIFRSRHRRQGGLRLPHRMRRSISIPASCCEAEALAADAYASADQAAMRIEKRLRRYKRRLKDHQATRANGQRRGELAPRSTRRATSSRRPSTTADEESTECQSGHHRRIDHGTEAAVGQRSGDGTRHDRRRRHGVPPRWTRPHQSGLPPRGRAYRLDRSADRSSSDAH